MTALGFSKKIKDSPPDEDWFEKKWVDWHPKYNNENLDISLKKDGIYSIKSAYPYDVEELPSQIKILKKDERSNFWSDRSNYNFSEDSSFLKYVDYFKNKKILEIGPGRGRQYKYLKDISLEYSIADISQSILNDPIYSNVKNKYLLDNYFITLGKKFDIIHLWYVLHHLTKTEIYSIVNFLFDHLKDDGILLFNYPSHSIEKKYLANKLSIGMKTSYFEKDFIKNTFEDKFDTQIFESGKHFNVIARKNRKWLN